MTNLSASELTKLTTMIDGQPRGRLASSLKTFDRLKATLAKHIVFQKAGDKGLYTITPKNGFKTSDPRIHAQVLERHQGATILNTLPTETAYTAFSECSE